MRNRRKRIKTAFPLVAIALMAGVTSGCGGGGSSSTSAVATSPDGSGNVLPVATNPIRNTSAAPGLTITKVLVENNVSPDTGKAVDDHLEIAIKNTSAKPLDQVEVYYKITDPAKSVSEGYHTKLDGFVVDPGATRVVHFDNTGAPDHYPENQYSLYHTDKNALVVDVVVSAAGVKPATFAVNKDAAGAEAGVE